MGEVEGRGVHQRHRSGAKEASRLHPRGTQGHRRDRPTPAAMQAEVDAELGRAGGELPGSCIRRFDARAIAARLGRSASTVSREVERNGGRGSYRALKADERAWERARRPKRCLLAKNDRLRELVGKKLREDWSPQRISGWLAKQYPDDEAMNVSHETIYRTLFVQTRGALKKEPLAHLRSRRMMRRARCAPTAGQPRGQITRTPSRSVNARPRSKTVQYPDTGKETCSPDHATPT
jgi:hypothetical protein